MAPRILICSASVGSGHGRAAGAIENAISSLRPDAPVRHVDILNLANPIFRRIYGKGYFDAINHFPHIVRYFYDRLDRPPEERLAQPLFVRHLMDWVNLRDFINLLVSEPWDLVISTHFLPMSIISTLRSAGRVAFPQAVVTTDFDIHHLWVDSPVERYFTATEEGRVNLAGWGVPAQQITASGIPIDPVFCKTKSSLECRAKHGIVGDRPVVLQLSGGGGFGPAEKVHRAILNTATPLEIVSVCGKNAALRQRLNAMACPSMHRRTVLGFTHEIDELMAAADVVITKPGGLTVSESLARGAAMMVIEPIPGQEDRNCDFLLENGAALKVNNLASLPHKLERLVNDPVRLQSLRDASAKLGRPFAAFDVARSVLSLIERDRPIARLPAVRKSRIPRLRFRRWRRSKGREIISVV